MRRRRSIQGLSSDTQQHVLQYLDVDDFLNTFGDEYWAYRKHILQNYDMNTILLWYVQRGQLDIVKDLISQGVNVAPVETLFIAGHQGNLEMFQLLWSLVPYSENDFDELFVDIITSGHLNIIQYLCSMVNYDNMTLMEGVYVAAQHSYWDILQYLVEQRGVPISSSTMRMVASQGNMALVKYCIIHGAVDIPIYMAAAENAQQTELVQRLRSLMTCIQECADKILS
jgi:hypothetical protein